jgi:DNA-binding transcriptional MerR regulator
VGELARRTGLTVRTLHHWEEVGLLEPTRRTPAGHRVYGPAELRTLQKILSLKELGLSLEDTRAYLRSRDASLEDILRAQRRRVREQVTLLRELGGRLDQMLELLESNRVVGDDELLKTMEVMTMIEKHYTREQLEALEERKKALGPEAIRTVEEEWPRLIARVKEEMEKGTDPTSPAILVLARRWKELVEAFSGGDRGIETSLSTMYREEPDMARQQGFDPALFGYIGAAMKALEDES